MAAVWRGVCPGVTSVALGRWRRGCVPPPKDSPSRPQLSGRATPEKTELRPPSRRRHVGCNSRGAPHWCPAEHSCHRRHKAVTRVCTHRCERDGDARSAQVAVLRVGGPVPHNSSPAAALPFTVSTVVYWCGSLMCLTHSHCTLWAVSLALWLTERLTVPWQAPCTCRLGHEGASLVMRLHRSPPPPPPSPLASTHFGA